jgi:glycosyltransferase involved in cell wall biosynthesis
MRTWHLTKTITGGAGQYAFRLSNALRVAGTESTLLVAEGTDGEQIELLRRVHSPVRRFAARGFRSVSHRISLGPFHSLRGPEIYQIPQPIQPGDIVHLHGMTGWIGISGMQQLIPVGAKVLWTAHDLWMISGGCVVYRGCEEFRRNCSGCPILRSPWKGMAKMELEAKRLFVQKFGVTPIANSQWTADRIKESSLFRHLKVIPIIPPIVDDAYFSEEVADLRQELGISAERMVISLGARSIDDKFKGIPQFLAELSRADDLANNLTVLVFGPGQIEIPPNLDVRMLGGKSDPEQVARIYRTSNLHISPSLMETFGMTLVEAQACGTPVLTFAVGGTPEAVLNEKTGWLVPVGDFPALIEQTRLILSDKSGLATAGQRARVWVRETFSGASVAARQSAVYLKVIGKSPVNAGESF